MGLRESLNRKPVLTTAATVAVIAGTLSWIGLSLRNPRPGPAGPEPRRHYTADDGLTTFVLEGERPVPFAYAGRRAVIAHLFTCDGGKTRFVGYLEKLSDGALRDLQYAPRTRSPAEAERRRSLLERGKLLKRPGDPETAWVPANGTRGQEIRLGVKCPNGDEAMPVVAD